MAFPWRKVKSHKISKLVNDHLHNSRKRRDGSSLVVETGFPTSLVDLFMKNREKLKKASKKKKRNNNNHVSIDAAEDPISCERYPSIPSSPTSSDTTEYLDVGVANDVECDGSSGSSLVVVFKLFLVVFFVLGTSRLTMGITISASVLLFLDYLQNRLSGIMNPCFSAKVLFWRSSDTQNCGEILVQGDCGLTETEFVETGDNSAIIMEEIQEETVSSSASQEVRLEDLLQQQGPQSKKTSKRAKMKSKLKRFFAKSFKGRKLETEEVNQTEEEISSQVAGGQPPTSTPPCGDEDIVPTFASVHEVLRPSKVEQAGNKTTRQFRAKDTRAWRLFLICVIILLGLLASRPFSILVTVFSFFLLSFVGSRWA